MAVYYVGAGGLDTNAGTSWATRLLTLNAAEDAHGGGTPKPAIAAGDSVYVGPGVYRETLTVDVSGAVGSPITYIADVTGEHTDGVGGVVRISGSNDDQTRTRTSCITASAKNYRTFRGFYLEGCAQSAVTASIYGINCTNWIVEDCTLIDFVTYGIFIDGASQLSWTIQRCMILGNSVGIIFNHTVSVSNAGHVVKNCIISAPSNQGVVSWAIGGIVIRNCLFTGNTCIRCAAALAAGQTIVVNNCSFFNAQAALSSIALGYIVEDYNNISTSVGTARTNVAIGANSKSYLPVLQPPVLNSGVAQVSGFQFPWAFGALSQWSPIRAIAGNLEATEDLFGITRPATAALNSWGPIQFQQITQDTATVRTGTLSQEFTTAGRRQLIIPVQAVNTTVTVYVYREANYAGINPQMIIKQSGQADIVVTDAGGAGVWNQLTHTWIPSAVPTWIVIELVSNNTAGAGAFAVYFDDLTVSPLDTDTQEAWLTATQPVNYAEEATVASAAFSPVGGEIVGA